MDGISTNSHNIQMQQMQQQAPVAEVETPAVSTEAPVAAQIPATAAPDIPTDSYAQKGAANTMVGGSHKNGMSAAFNSTAGRATFSAVKTTAAEKVELPNSLDPKALEQPAKQLAAWLDVSQAMKPAAYNNVVTDLDSKSGFYMQAVNVATLQRNDINKKIDELSQKADPDPVQMEQLQNLRDMADGMISLYTNLSQAGSAKAANREKDCDNLWADLTNINIALAGLDPSIVGQDVVDSLKNSVAQITDLAFAFPTMQTDPNCSTPSRQLGVFFAQTFKRLQQIKDGNRTRASETPDMAGALKTYENDARDCTKRMAMFASVREKVVSEHITDETVIYGMLKECIKGAPSLEKNLESFARAYANLAEADIHHQEAQNNLMAAQQELSAGQQKLSEAETKLLLAQTAMGVSSNKVVMSASQTDITKAAKQRTLNDAKTLQKSAVEYTDQAASLIGEFYTHQQKGEQYADLAKNEAETAVAYLDMATFQNEVIKNGAYGRYFQQETGKIDGHIATTRQDLTAIQGGAENIKEQFSQLDSFATTLMQQQSGMLQSLADLDAGISMVELIDTTDQLSQKGVTEAYRRITTTINNYAEVKGIKLSDDFKAFLRDPEGFLKAHPNEEGNMREKMSDLLDDHPDLAEKVAGELSGIRHDFAVSRQQLEKKLKAAGKNPNDPAVKAQLDALEASLVNGLMNTNPFLFSALAAGVNKNTTVANDMLGWMRTVQQNMAGHIVGDETMRKNSIDQFDKLVATDSSFKDIKQNIADRKREYGEIKSTECLSVYMSDTGTVRPMNVYIFQKDGKYYALDPMTNNVYKGATKDAAMKDLASSYNSVNGQVSYADSKGDVHSYAVSRPKESIGMDIGMGALGVVGGVLMLIPEPTTVTKFAGYGCIAASSAYFVTKGTTAIIEQVSHDNFDLGRPESRAALIDIVSGLLTVAGGAVGGAAQGAGVAIQGGRTLGVTTSTAAKLSKAATILSKTNTAWVVSTSTVGFGESLTGILTNDSLSDEQKALAILVEMEKLGISLAGAH